ncbi:hypothetical protein B2M20_06125 [Nitrobacter vulgaris]|uniref:Uncharacterized protein n=1 Tax=Nitrobacter vulgaris TaxID=29421 RepID=A0A1V4I0F5_NITVU|nr:hypothetical protein B2M20_06125 [Nitrobacter vulgaris]
MKSTHQTRDIDARARTGTARGAEDASDASNIFLRGIDSRRLARPAEVGSLGWYRHAGIEQDDP